ncbi:MAG: DRTGG domain-containing protein [candidate division Zixibacteria bacterium]|jgi:predicted transcriptional regulator|nr:DRTGG domain-containing protein [candidate division Zixibacteria bacterium]
MTTKDLIEKLGLKPLSKFEHRDINGVFVSDMLSDVMAGAKSGNIWLTVQTHKSIVPAANLVDVSAIIVTGGKDVPQETIDIASKYNIAILSTNLPTFELVGKLYGLGPLTK